MLHKASFNSMRDIFGPDHLAPLDSFFDSKNAWWTICFEQSDRGHVPSVNGWSSATRISRQKSLYTIAASVTCIALQCLVFGSLFIIFDRIIIYNADLLVAY